ncbi:MAG: hypothetical protein HN726_03855 [Candidatus Magasanikbacteria bacterium]|nr:hypothetical protein [Candidatus Magasanikbacteria bacterium]MBT4221280.1 hypothetical protein [Candidatus Magasanikbacteria bacterium]MBT4350426.1 hypothetical protein [Candidatus Magasanikbacteria bacterium]MBT4542027.1 hypothetical protein [Candidatus Magasanikbacteria bacterium]MBT6253404.1 hypothetical protein [Candidatus Magasanikbacteria bacterium]
MSDTIYPIKLYIKHLPIAIMGGASILANLLTWGWLLWYIQPQDGFIFLHYNILFGVDYSGEWWRVLYLPLIGFLIFCVNAILAWLLFHKDKFIAQLLHAVSLFCQIFLFIIAQILIFLNV